MQAANAAAAQALLAHMNDCLKALMRKHTGYLCQQEENEYMIAFASGSEAIMFCVRVLPSQQQRQAAHCTC